MLPAKKKCHCERYVMTLSIFLAIGCMRYLENQSRAKSSLLFVTWIPYLSSHGRAEGSPDTFVDPHTKLFNDALTDSTSCWCFLLPLIFFPCLTPGSPQDYLIYYFLKPPSYFIMPPEPNLNFKLYLIEVGWYVVALRKKWRLKSISKWFIFQMKWALIENSGIQ